MKDLPTGISVDSALDIRFEEAHDSLDKIIVYLKRFEKRLNQTPRNMKWDDADSLSRVAKRLDDLVYIIGCNEISPEEITMLHTIDFMSALMSQEKR